MGRVVAAYAYRCGCRIAEIQLGDSAAWAREKGDFVWIGFHEPTEQDLRMLQAQFGLHELAVEDALSAHQVPKLEVYGDSLFVVLRTAQLDHGKVVFGETCIFVGAGLHHQRPPGRLAVLPAGAAALRGLAQAADARRRLRAARAARLRRRQLHAGGGGGGRGGRRDRGAAAPGPARPCRHRADLRAAARAGAAAPGGSTDGRGLLAAAPRRAAVHGQEHAALLQGRARPRGAGQRDHRRPARGAELRLRGRASPGIGPAGRRLAPVRRLGRDPGGADRARRHLRHELRVHAGAAVALRLLHGAGADLRCRGPAVLAVPAAPAGCGAGSRN